MIGHEGIQSALEKIVRENALGHAYLFFGDSQIGKASCAEHLANLVEKGVFERPSTQLLDTAVFEPNEKGNIGIDEVRGMKRSLWQTPLSSSKRIAIIDGADALTPEAQSAMLKIVEEPPAHGLLIFITHDPEALLAPLVSRLSKIYFSRLSTEKMEHYLVEAGVSAKKASDLAAKSFGRIGRALDLLKGSEMNEEAIERTLEEDILSLYSAGALKNSAKLAWLLAREESVRRFNVNPNIQKKAIEYIVNRSYN